jgi:hypothetical protein
MDISLVVTSHIFTHNPRIQVMAVRNVNNYNVFRRTIEFDERIARERRVLQDNIPHVIRVPIFNEEAALHQLFEAYEPPQAPLNIGILNLLPIERIPESAPSSNSSTSVPSTSVPSTSVPSTSVPSTSVPSTSVPSTSVPSCPICLENYSPNQERMYLPCFHSYHRECITEWFGMNSTCPLCKINVEETFNIRV